MLEDFGQGVIGETARKEANQPIEVTPEAEIAEVAVNIAPEIAEETPSMEPEATEIETESTPEEIA